MPTDNNTHRKVTIQCMADAQSAALQLAKGLLAVAEYDAHRGNTETAERLREQAHHLEALSSKIVDLQSELSQVLGPGRMPEVPRF